MTLYEALVALRLGVVAVGTLAGLWSLRLALRSSVHRWTYFLLATGFGLITLGAIVEGILFEFFRWDLVSAHTVEALVSIAGFALILTSIVRSSV